jgi:hypothetical protein
MGRPTCTFALTRPASGGRDRCLGSPATAARRTASESTRTNQRRRALSVNAMRQVGKRWSNISHKKGYTNEGLLQVWTWSMSSRYSACPQNPPTVRRTAYHERYLLCG